MIATAAMAAAALVSGSGLNCALGFDALDAQMKGSPKIAPYTSGDPLLATYNDSASLSLYVITLPGHAAHPTIAKRKINGMGPGMTVDTSACGYGDPAAFERLLQHIEILNAGVRKSFGG